MLKKIKIFVITGICSVFVINNTTAQDKKIFDNVGVYFSPMLDIKASSGIPLPLYFDEFILGFRTNLKISQKYSISLGVGYGHGSYFSLTYRLPQVGSSPPIVHRQLALGSKILQANLYFRYNIMNIEDKNFIYVSSGILFNNHIYEKYFFVDKSSGNIFIYENKNLRLFNVKCAIAAGYNLEINKSFSLNTELNFTRPFLYGNDIEVRDNYIATSRLAWINFGISLGFIYNW